MKRNYSTFLSIMMLLIISGCSMFPIGDQTAVGPSTTLMLETLAETEIPTLAAPTETIESVSPTLISPTEQPVAEALPHASLPDPVGTGWELILGGMRRPVDLVHARDGSGRLFVLEQAGIIQVIKDQQVVAQPFLDIRDRVGSSGNEQGLLGIAFHPKFSENGYFYLNYTDYSGDTVISRFTAPLGESSDHPVADPSSELVLLRVDQPYANHNGGQLIFGPDGYLWIGLGDGGSQGDPNGNGQNPNALLGKILRIDVDGGDPYAIPVDNPYASGGGSPEVWAIGLRNPWRFSFDHATGDLYIADVGQGKWEEIDFYASGPQLTPPNYGWNIREGNHTYSGGVANTELIDPVFEYGHDVGCSVTGGMVYRGKALPQFTGVYLFGDYCSGTIWGLVQNDGNWQTKELFQTPYKIASFGEDQDGEIYLMDLNGGVYQLAPL